MAVFLSPGVFPREIDLSVLPAGAGALTPAFIGTANKGPFNTPTFISDAQQAIDTFGEPFPESFLMYALLAYFEEGSRAWVLRVGVECEEGQADALADVCVDASGAREEGWGRIAVFTGIDFGKICTRVIDSDNPLVFHDASVEDIDFNDIDVSSTDGPTTATLSFSGTGLSSAYTGAIDDCFTVLVASAPDAGSLIGGALIQVTRNSDGEIIFEDEVTEPTTGESSDIDIGDGLIFQIEVSGSSPLEEGDTFTFCAVPDNLDFSFNVDRETSPATHSLTDGEMFTSASDFADRINTIIGAAEDFQAIAQDDDTVCFRTKTAGESIQLISTEAFALEVGQVLWAFDIPRSNLRATIAELYDITTSNNRINIRVIESTTTELEFTIAVGLDQTAADVAAQVNLGGQQSGDRFFRSFALTMPGGENIVIIEADVDHQFGQLRLLANSSHVKSLRFAEELGILSPFTTPFRAFNDTRVVLPDPGTLSPSTPLSCEVSATSDECLRDTAYFQNIVGWFVAKTPGTWVNSHKLDLQLSTNTEAFGGDAAERFRVRIFDGNGTEVDAIENVSFDPTEERYIANLINEGSSIGGTNGNDFVQWISRPSFLNNDPIGDPSNFEVRIPSPINNRNFSGGANGIPLDPAFSSEIDRVTIGNPAEETGIFAFQNPEVFDISLLLIPGSSSGAVIAQGLSMAEGRGDILYIVDPPIGLRPQQIVDWHNGMLFSDLAASLNSSFGSLYFPHLKIFDQFNNTEIFVPPSGHISAVFARTARVAEQWFAPAGLRRGRLLTALDTEVDLTQGERDLLYGFNNAVNPIVNFPQDGITVFGQRTLQRADTALDRVNVRMLLIFIKKNAVELLRNFIFEQNDRITRTQVVSIMEGFLSDIQARRGLQGFSVVCDSSNNTPERIDRNELHVALFLKPTRAIEFIVLNLVILRSEQSFAAEEVLAAGGVVT